MTTQRSTASVSNADDSMLVASGISDCAEMAKKKADNGVLLQSSEEMENEKKEEGKEQKKEEEEIVLWVTQMIVRIFNDVLPMAR